MGGVARGDGRAGTEGTELKPIEPHTFPQGVLEEEMATAAKMRPDLTALGAGAIGAGLRGGSGEVRLRPARERIRELGRRPHIVCRLGR